MILKNSQLIATVAVIVVVIVVISSVVIIIVAGDSEADGFFFIDTHTHREGTVINGSYPVIAIDFPMYQYDAATEELHFWGVYSYVNVNDSLKAILGVGTSLGGDIGMGAGTTLQSVHSIPFSSGNVELTSIDSSGTATLEFSGYSMRLEPGQSWFNETTMIECESENSCAEVTTNLTVTNYGWLSLSQFIIGE